LMDAGLFRGLAGGQIVHRIGGCFPHRPVAGGE
jgi:hypothetical protein